MKAITIRQPYARCIAMGAKTVENRGRSTSHRGLIAIHAAAAGDVTADRDPRVTALFGSDPRLGAVTRSIVAVASLADCHQADGCCAPWGDAGYNGKQAWHLVLDSAVMLWTPVPARGSLALPWTVPAEVANAVRVQLAEQDVIA